MRELGQFTDKELENVYRKRFGFKKQSFEDFDDHEIDEEYVKRFGRAIVSLEDFNSCELEDELESRGIPRDVTELQNIYYLLANKQEQKALEAVKIMVCNRLDRIL